MTFVADYEPKALWGHFDRILTIPRPSKDEEKMRRYVIGVAERNELPYQVDGAGNVVVSKPASEGREEVPITILQSHLDMVQQANSDAAHDWANDAIQPRRDGDYLYATGTTLGSDNGIGVAAMLALMEATDLDHGPLELLFTIDEESGLTGAAQLDASMLKGRRLINLDSEEEGSLCVGCAGGADSTLSLDVSTAATAPGSAATNVRLYGLKGGHSGVDIHLQRGNATKLLVRALYAAGLETPLSIATLQGGNAHNAIPREAHATVIANADSTAALRERLEKELAAIRDEYRPAEPDLAWEIADADAPAETWDGATTTRVLQLVSGLPHGVMSMSYDIPGLVETSTNLATVAAENGALVIGMSSRSSVASALAALRQRIRATATLAGAAVEEGNGYPGWQPDLDSELLGILKRLHETQTGAEPKVEAIHAGLECGLIGEMIPGMDMISFGPQIEFPHSPDERVHVDSVGRFYDLLTATLAELAKG